MSSAVNEVKEAEGGAQGMESSISIACNVEARQAQLIELLERQIVGQTELAIKTKNELMRMNVNGVKMEAIDEVKGSGKGKSDVLGMLLCQNVKRMLEFGGLELELMLETNFDVITFHDERKKKFNQFDQIKTETAELVDEIVTKPSREEMEDTIKLAGLEKRGTLRRERADALSTRRALRKSSSDTSVQSESELERKDALNKIEEAVREEIDEVSMREIRKYKIEVSV